MSADIKPLLMDSKFLPGKAEDNEAQAGNKPCSVNVANKEALILEKQCSEHGRNAMRDK